MLLKLVPVYQICNVVATPIDEVSNYNIFCYISNNICIIRTLSTTTPKSQRVHRLKQLTT